MHFPFILYSFAILLRFASCIRTPSVLIFFMNVLPRQKYDRIRMFKYLNRGGQMQNTIEELYFGGGRTTIRQTNRRP